MIRYHDGWSGERIGPVSSLAFHPLQMMVAGGGGDGIVNIFSIDHVF